MPPLRIAVASISWFAFERPINGLKRYFPYKQALDQHTHRDHRAPAQRLPPGRATD